MFKEKVKYAFYTLGHPSDGFYEIRHRGRGSVGLSILFVFLFAVCFSANRQYAGFVVNHVNPMEINSLAEICAVFLLFLLFCVGNWSITCLMDGEGRFKDIVTVCGYAMLPMILTFIPAILFSQVVAEDEEAFYYLLLAVGIAWFFVPGAGGYHDGTQLYTGKNTCNHDTDFYCYADHYFCGNAFIFTDRSGGRICRESL